MVLPILASLGTRALTGLASLTIGSLSQIGDIAGATTSALGDSRQSLSDLIIKFQIFAQSAQGAYNSTIGANEKLNQSLLKSQIILSGVTDSYDRFGNKITSTADKIKSFKAPLGDARRSLEKETLDLVGVTSELTFNVFDKVLRQFGSLQGQSKGFKTDIEAVTALSKNLTAALGTFGLTDVVQIEQEIRSLLTGDYNNPDSVLNKSLGLSKEERAKARSEGREIEYILSKTEDAVVGNKLGADSLTNTLSNIADTVQIFLRDISAPFGDIISKELQGLNSELKKILVDPEFKDQSEAFFRTLVTGAISLGKSILAIGKFLSDLGIGTLLSIATKMVVQTITVVTELLGLLDDLSNWIIEKIINPVTTFVTDIWKKITDPVGELANAIKNIPNIDIIINSKPFEDFKKGVSEGIRIPIISDFLDNQKKVDQSVRDQIKAGDVGSKGQRYNYILAEKDAISKLAKSAEIDERKVIDLRNQGFSFKNIVENEGNKNSPLNNLLSLKEVKEDELTAPSVRRLEALKSVVKLEMDSESKKLFDQLVNLENNANISNVGERKALVNQLSLKLTGTEKLNIEANKYLSNNISYAKSILEGAKGDGASSEAIKEAQAYLTSLENFAKEETMEADLIILPKLAKDTGTLKKQLAESITSSLSTIANSETIVDVGKGVDELIKNLPEAIKTGAITQEKADEIFSDLVKSQKLNFSQLLSVQSAYTQTIQDESAKRIALIQMEEDTVSAKYAKGLITKRERDKEINEYAIEKNKEQIKTLEAQLKLALTKSEGKESQETQAYRVQIGTQIAKGASLDAQSVSIEYNADIQDLEKANEKFAEINSRSRELSNQNLIRLTTSGSISGNEKDLKESQANIKNINDDILTKRRELGELGKLTSGLSEEEKDQNRKLISQKRLEILQLQTQELQAQLGLVEKLFNKELSDLEKSSSKKEIIQQRENLEKKILDLSLENSDTQLEIENRMNSINTILEDISQSEEKLVDLRNLDAKTKDQQEIKEEKISQEINNQLGLKVNLLEIQREIIGSLNKIEDKERDIKISQLNNQLQAIRNEKELLDLRRELGLIKTSSDRIEDTRKLIKPSNPVETKPSEGQKVYEETYERELRNRDPGGESLNQFESQEDILGRKRQEYQEKYWRLQDQKSEGAKQLASEIADLEAKIIAEKERALKIADEERAKKEAEKALELERQQIAEAERIAEKVKEIETLESKLAEIELKIQELEIAKQIAKIESDASIAKLEAEKEVLRLTLARLKAEGLLTPEAAEAAGRAIAATDKQIGLARERQALDQQNYQDQIDSNKQALDSTKEKIGLEKTNLEKEVENGLEPLDKSIKPGEALDKIKSEGIKKYYKPPETDFIEKAVKSGKAIIDISTDLNRKSIPPAPKLDPILLNNITPSIDNSTNSQDSVTVVNNFPTYSEERNTKRLLGF